MQHAIQNFLPSSFENVWTLNCKRRNEDQPILRNNQDFYVQAARLVSTSRQPIIAFPSKWNSLNIQEIKKIRNKLEFKKKLKKHLLGTLETAPICTRLFCPACSRT
jgi:hypothetical protein